VRLAALFGTALALAGAFISCRQERRYGTCAVCGSTRVVDSWHGEKLLYRSPDSGHGQHVWRLGISSSVRVPSGVVVLARRQAPGSSDPVYGAFILTKQEHEPDRVSYRWFLRSDGLGLVEPAFSSSGHEENQERVAFGPFRIGWSAAGGGAGYLYYARYAHEAPGPSDTYLCVTSETDVARLDTAAAKWRYRFSPVP
jgi:hypothetical protein